jgi:hypothetical protein
LSEDPIILATSLFFKKTAAFMDPVVALEVFRKIFYCIVIFSYWCG